MHKVQHVLIKVHHIKKYQITLNGDNNNKILPSLSVCKWSGEMISVIYYQSVCFGDVIVFYYLTLNRYFWINQPVEYYMLVQTLHHLYRYERTLLGVNISFYLENIDRLFMLLYHLNGIHSGLMDSLVSTTLTEEIILLQLYWQLFKSSKSDSWTME